MQARSDLHKKKVSQQGSDAVSDADEKERLREAQRKLRIAEEKVTLVKKLIPALHHAIAEYHSHSQPLGDHLSGGFELRAGRAGKDDHRAGILPGVACPHGAPECAGRFRGPEPFGASATTTAAESPDGADATATQPAEAEPAGSPATAGEALVSGRTS